MFKSGGGGNCNFCGLSVSPAPCGDDRCADDVMQKGDKAEEGRSNGSAGGQWMGGASI